MPGSYLKIRAESRGPVSVLALTGELDLTTVGDFADKAAGILAARPARVIVDLSGLKFSDCCGARTLAALANSRPGGCKVVLRAARPRVRRVLDLVVLPCDPPAPGYELRYPRDPAALAGTVVGRLVHQSRLARSQSRYAREESRRSCEMLADAGETIAAGLARMAELRPRAAARLECLSQEAGQQAAVIRRLTRPAER
jgi:anti-anti-sigma factor